MWEKFRQQKNTLEDDIVNESQRLRREIDGLRANIDDTESRIDQIAYARATLNVSERPLTPKDATPETIAVQKEKLHKEIEKWRSHIQFQEDHFEDIARERAILNRRGRP